MKINSSYPVIMCDNLQEVSKFYTEHFDMDVVYSSDWYISLAYKKEQSDFELAILDYRHETVPSSFREKSKGIIINMEVDEVDAFYELLVRERKVPPVMDIKSEDFGQRHFIVSDPAGIMVDVIQMVPPSKEYEAFYNN